MFEFYYQHLEHVSRSFSFCIKELNEPLRSWVALSYLLCRITDTIEDSQWQDKKQQIDVFNQFESFLSKSPTKEEYTQWLLAFPQVKPAEQNLLNDGMRLLIELHQLGNSVKHEIKACVITMLKGMQQFQQQSGTFRLNSVEEVDSYCYFVAGRVGLLLSKLNALYNPSFRINQVILNQSVQFGLFLQKINIFKDQLLDESESRYLIPCRTTFLAQLPSHARQAMDYIQSIPTKDNRQFRLACAWPLFIGLASLPWINKSYDDKEIQVIPQKVTLDLVHKIRGIIDDNNALEILFQQYLKPIPILNSA